MHSSNDNIITKKGVYKTITCTKQCRQPPTVSLTFVRDKIPFFGILCQSSFWSPFLGFVLFLGVSFCRINLDNRVILVSCVELLKTKFNISFCEFRVDHCFLHLVMIIFLLHLEFFVVESTEAFTESTDSVNSPIIPPPDLKPNFHLKGTAYQNHN